MMNISPELRSPAARQTRRTRAPFLRDEAGGAGSAWGLFMAAVFILIGGVATDYSFGHLVKADLQNATDAAALAALQDLPNATAAVQSAISYAKKNDPKKTVNVAETNVTTGRWLNSTRTFVPNGHPTNAVKVVLTRSGSDATQVKSFLMRLAGVDSFDVSAAAIAAIRPRCLGGRIFAKSLLKGNSNSSVSDGFCLHGEGGVHINNNNVFEAGTEISNGVGSTFRTGNKNPGIELARVEKSKELKLVDEIDSVYNGVRNGTDHLPSWITNGPVHVPNLPAYPTRGTIYVVSGNVVINDGTALEEIAIVTSGKITVNSNTTMSKVVLAAGGLVDINSNVDIGSSSYCSEGAYDSYIVSKDRVELNSNDVLRGVQIASKKDFVINSNAVVTDGIVIETGGNADFNSNLSFGGCPDALVSNVFDSIHGDNSLVQ
ncbi:hypothetical protein BV394_03710 [Brevirhabdus pacifica]|uniref:Uncharacterized protein n=2 Tax=Brevirhabdus pacifica TaxID=1267768 RepID=A0A1U7DG18_9RHOB|nr:TadG family pilus assembly protein [Brevirhabdus pacifica]APX88944.1 hypothetical protein BV394_03710 [Brevirhabdus pacifica]OWU80170.1 hypothetical protein ATO5_04395 [Loktanella sp. 22II-4b]PJJ86503.1 putative Tad-like protein involved in Flp pilus assembly [Brevirhabdus pacifica]